MALTLVLGNKNYSSWSMRPWILMHHFGLKFEELVIPLYQADSAEMLRRYSPSLKVPVLIDDELSIWESMAICEYVNDNYLQDKALPNGREARALCRAYCHEMHAGFGAIRSAMPMNCRARRTLPVSAAVQPEVERIDALWHKARRRYREHGDYLFGSFSMADALFAPIVMRFQTYDVPVSQTSADYMTTMLANASVVSWYEDACKESAEIAIAEVGEPR